MNAQEIQRAAVLGAGTMGHGIAQVLAMQGVRVHLFDVNAEAVQAGLAKVAVNLQKGVDRGKVTEETRDEAFGLLRGVTTMDDACEGVELVIEAAPEIMEIKLSVFEDLGARLGPEVLLATNTSSLPISDIASAAAHPERVVGMHFFNPVHIMKLLEVVRADQSSDEAVECAMELGRRIGKEPILVTDSPGFASSRLGIVIGLEAMRMFESGVASAEDIDKAMKLGYGFPMGPLELTDLVGLDVRLSIAEYLHSELGETFAPPRILRDKVDAGELGKKSGQGFYDWTER
ncbi:MAG: 3-hydroxyacyl-CoA dehydrogenase family protein [Planctomycetes bacterium]|nr:3-hydroxyacyl-CoA dehydrogenase family protein [Planctomycetota bacterium]